MWSGFMQNISPGVHQGKANIPGQDLHQHHRSAKIQYLYIVS